MAQAPIRYLDRLSMLGFKDITGIGDGKAVRLDHLNVGSAGNNAAFGEEFSSSFESPADDRHDAALHAAGFTDCDGFSYLRTDLQSKRQLRQHVHDGLNCIRRSHFSGTDRLL
jgi:hypothetical protein